MIRALPGAPLPESFWRSLRHLNRFRYFLTLFFLIGPRYVGLSVLGQEAPRQFLAVSLAYGALALLADRFLVRQRPPFELQVLAQVTLDALFIVYLMHLSGGNGSGLGLLLMVPLAAAGMHPQVRSTLFLAAFASLLILIEQVAQSLYGADDGGFLRAGLLSTGLFAVALFSHFLAGGTLSASKLAGEKAAQAEELARINARVIEDLPHGVLVIDRLGSVVQHNARAEALLECRMYDLASLSHCAPQLERNWRAWRDTGVASGQPFNVGHSHRHLRARFSELEPTRREGAIIVVEDMTELEQTAQNMKLAALGRLTANLAHEIRNPLSAIHQAASLLHEETQAEPLLQRLTTIIDSNSQRLNTLVEDVLALSRRDRLDTEAVAVDEFLRAFVLEFQQSEEIPAGMIVVQAPETLRICFDRLHLNQILWNLCRNAWRYCTRTPRSVQVRALAGEATAVVEVYNDGEPISAEMQARLFEPFYTTDRRGTGLGLHIARELAEANGSKLSYVDQPDGAMFRLSCRLPPCERAGARGQARGQPLSGTL